jgi:adenylate cyclase
VRPEHDAFLNEALAGSTNTFFPIRLLERIDAEEGVQIAEFAEQLDLPASPGADPNARVPMQLPFVLDRSAWSRTGLVNYVEDADGVGRRYWLAREVGGWRIPSLPARVATALGYPLPEGDSFRLDWFRGVAPHPQISFSDFYEDLERASRTRAPDEFRGAIVVIGSSSNHLRDFRTTPVASLFPGVEILATAIDNLKNGERLTEASEP